MNKVHLLNIFLSVKHSADENDKAIFGLFVPLTILIFFLILSNPLEVWKLKKQNRILGLFLYKFRYFLCFLMILVSTFLGILNGIRYLF